MELHVPTEVIWTAIGGLFAHAMVLLRLLWTMERRLYRLELHTGVVKATAE